MKEICIIENGLQGLIQPHNHNVHCLKQHKDALDQLRGEVEKQAATDPDTYIRMAEQQTRDPSLQRMLHLLNTQIGSLGMRIQTLESGVAAMRTGVQKSPSYKNVLVSVLQR